MNEVKYSEGTLLFDLKENATLIYYHGRFGAEVEAEPNRFREATKEEFENKPPRVFITPQQAINCLVDNEFIHTFVNPANNVLFGSDVNRSDIIDDINSPGVLCEIAGDIARGMNHGLVISFNDKRKVFIESKEDKLKEYDYCPDFN